MKELINERKTTGIKQKERRTRERKKWKKEDRKHLKIYHIKLEIERKYILKNVRNKILYHYHTFLSSYFLDWFLIFYFTYFLLYALLIVTLYLFQGVLLYREPLALQS